jgi:hypothetical protein
MPTAKNRRLADGANHAPKTTDGELASNILSARAGLLLDFRIQLAAE